MALRRGGRPTVGGGEPSANVQLRIPASLYDQVYALATRDRISVPEVIRRALRKEVVTETSRQTASFLS